MRLTSSCARSSSFFRFFCSSLMYSSCQSRKQRCYHAFIQSGRRSNVRSRAAHAGHQPAALPSSAKPRRSPGSPGTPAAAAASSAWSTGPRSCRCCSKMATEQGVGSRGDGGTAAASRGGAGGCAAAAIPGPWIAAAGAWEQQQGPRFHCPEIILAWSPPPPSPRPSAAAPAPHGPPARPPPRSYCAPAARLDRCPAPLAVCGAVRGADHTYTSDSNAVSTDRCDAGARPHGRPASEAAAAKCECRTCLQAPCLLCLRLRCLDRTCLSHLEWPMSAGAWEPGLAQANRHPTSCRQRPGLTGQRQMTYTACLRRS